MRLIDSDNLKHTLKSNCKPDLCFYYGTSWCENCCRTNDFEYLIDNAPTIEIPVARWDCYCEGQKVGYEKALSERPKGEWIYIEAGKCVCSLCGAIPHELYKNFCSKCGASMIVDNEV